MRSFKAKKTKDCEQAREWDQKMGRARWEEGANWPTKAFGTRKWTSRMVLPHYKTSSTHFQRVIYCFIGMRENMGI